MKKVTRIFSLLCAAAWILSAPVYSVAQDYDDDLYYSPSKAAEKKKKEDARRAAQRAQLQQEIDYYLDNSKSTDNYSAGSTRPLEMDVDAYNRRGGSESAVAADGPETPDFANTRRIERFHNPDVVVNTGDTALMQYYYSAPEAQDINVYVVNSIDYPSSWGWNYGYPSWRWRFGRPYWSLSWGYDPWFDFGWGYDPYWGPSWAWGPSWGWNWGWSWPGHWHPGHWNPGHWHPGHYPSYGPSHDWGYNRPGASRPHRPAYGAGSTGNRRPGYSGGNYRPSTNPGGNYRPGNMGRPSNNGNNGGSYRPSSPAGNGSNKNDNYRPSNNSRREIGRAHV